MHQGILVEAWGFATGSGSVGSLELLSRVPQLETLAAVGQDDVPPRLQPRSLQYLSPAELSIPS